MDHIKLKERIDLIIDYANSLYSVIDVMRQAVGYSNSVLNEIESRYVYLYGGLLELRANIALDNCSKRELREQLDWLIDELDENIDLAETLDADEESYDWW